MVGPNVLCEDATYAFYVSVCVVGCGDRIIAFQMSSNALQALHIIKFDLYLKMEGLGTHLPNREISNKL